jgi:adenine nucleotide transporter 17
MSDLFFQGFESAIYATSASQLVFFYLYSLLKDALIKRRGRMGPVDNIAVATIAGAINAFATAPIWLVVTRLAIQNKHHDDKDHMRGLLDGFAKIIKKEGITTLWSGITASLVLVSNPVIQFVCYEQFTKSLLRQRSKRAGKSVTALSAVEYFLLGALSKALATVLTYPYLTLKSRMQTGHGHQYAGFVDGIVTIYRHEGVAGFFKGLSAKFVQTVANAAFMFATYEYFLRITRKVVYRAAGLPVPKAIVSQ